VSDVRDVDSASDALMNPSAFGGPFTQQQWGRAREEDGQG